MIRMHSSSDTADRHTAERLAARITTLERRLRITMTSCILLASVAIIAWRQPVQTLRVSGLVVVDAQNRERIVIGAPFDVASPNGLLKGGVGIAVLDSLGRLATALGQGTPLVVSNGQLAPRMGHSNGLAIYDPRDGSERGGFGAFQSGRVNMCLDYAAGKEAACVTVGDRDAYTAMQLNGTPNEPQHDRVGMYVGSDGSAELKAFGGGRTHTGGIIIGAGDGPPSVKVYSPAIKVLRDLALPPR